MPRKNYGDKIKALEKMGTELLMTKAVLIYLDESGTQHCVTWGATYAGCKQAGQAAEFWLPLISLTGDKESVKAKLRELADKL